MEHRDVMYELAGLRKVLRDSVAVIGQLQAEITQLRQQVHDAKQDLDYWKELALGYEQHGRQE